MTTKTMIIALSAMLMLGVLAPLAFAEDTSIANNTAVSDNTIRLISANTDTSSQTESDLGLNESVSNSQIFWKQVGLWFTFNQEKKAEMELDLARLRLIQANVAAKHNDSEAMQKALDANAKLMDDVQKRVNAMEYIADGKNVSAPVVKLVALENAIAVHEQRLTFLNNRLANTNLTDEQKARIEDRINHVQNVTAKLQANNEAKKTKLITKIMAVKNLTEEQATALVIDREAAIRTNIQNRIANRLANKNSDNEDSKNSSN